MHRISRALIAVVVIATLAVPALIGGPSALSGLATLAPASLALIALMTVVGWGARAAKLWLLARRLDLRLRPIDAACISLATDFAFLTTPAGVGGYAANVLLLRRAGADATKATAITAADQIVDALFFAVVLPAAALIALGSSASPILLRVAFASSAVMLVAAVVVIALRARLMRWLAAACAAPVESATRVARLRRLLARSLRDTGRVLSGDRRYACAVIVLTSLQWSLRYGVLWAALIALGHSVPWAVVLLAQALVMHAAQWTGVPAGAGTAELGLAAALAPWLSSAALAPALLVWRVATLHLALIAGAMALVFLARRAPNTLDVVGDEGRIIVGVQIF